MKRQTKDRKRTNTDYIVAVTLILAVTAIIYIAYMMFVERLDRTSYAATTPLQENAQNTEISAKTQITPMKTVDISIENIIQENTNTLKKEEIIKQEIDLEYTTQYTEDPELPKGMLHVLQDGVDGKQEVAIKKIYEGENLISEEQMGSRVIESSVNKLVAIGTGPYASNYKVKVGDTLYNTSSLLPVRIEPNDKADKLITLKKNNEVKLLQKQGDWYQVQYQSYIGWAKGECFTYLDPNSSKEETSGTSQYTKKQLLNKLNFNMKLNEPSGLSLEQFKKIFENEPKDKKKIFANNAQYFYYAEKQYKVNGVFIAAVAIHESGWGGSAIASDKKNLFGYGAYDRSPYESAYQFTNYSEGIDLLGRVFAKYYLNPKGTKIYDGNIASGSYYNGPTLSGVNVKYATDKNWKNGVYSWMKYLYNNL